VTVVEVDAPRKRIGLSMKSDPFADQGVPAQSSGGKGKRDDKGQGPAKGQGPRRENNRSESKPQEKEVSMEEKLAMLVSKFKK
jgi:uncharacterized protein